MPRCEHTVVSQAGRVWQCSKPIHDDDRHYMVRTYEEAESCRGR